MLRVAGRRLSSSLSWRPAAAAARGPLAGAGAPGGDDDSARARSQPRFSIESPFLAAVRGKRAPRPPPLHAPRVLV
jgi:ubiquinol-cytochrome c reductase iron-sulfur subunit